MHEAKKKADYVVRTTRTCKQHWGDKLGKALGKAQDKVPPIFFHAVLYFTHFVHMRADQNSSFRGLRGNDRSNPVLICGPKALFAKLSCATALQKRLFREKRKHTHKHKDLLGRLARRPHSLM